MSGTTNLTLKQRRKMQGIAMPVERADRSGKKELSKGIALLILLLAFGVGVAAGMIYFRPDQRIVDLNQMEAVMNEARGDMPSDARDFLEEQSMTIRDQLPRQHEDRHGGFSGFMGHFFNMAPADQVALLQRMEEGRMRREQMRAQQDQQNGGASNSSAQASSSGGNNNSNRSGRGRDATSRTERMEQHLAQRPPQQRGQFTLMRQMGGAVRQQMNSK